MVNRLKFWIIVEFIETANILWLGKIKELSFT